MDSLGLLEYLQWWETHYFLINLLWRELYWITGKLFLLLRHLDPGPDSVRYYPRALDSDDTTGHGLGDGQWWGPKNQKG